MFNEYEVPLFLFVVINVLGQTRIQAQDNLYISINNQECINCLGQIAQIPKLSPQYNKVLVFPKRYQVDSTVVWERLFLNEVDYDQVLWSDSLYNQFRNHGVGYESTITLVNEATGKCYKTMLANLDRDLHYYNQLILDSTVIEFKERPLGADVTFNTSGNYWYFFDNLNKAMKVYDRSSTELLYTHKMTDSLAEIAFSKRFGKNSTEWKQAQVAYKRRNVIDANDYSNYYFSQDTCYLLGSHKFLEVLDRGEGIDSIMSTFFTLSIYKGQRLVDFSVVENYIGPERSRNNIGIRRPNVEDKVEDEDSYFILTGKMIVSEGLPYFSVMGKVVKGEMNHFLVRYKKGGDGKWVLDRFYPRDLPELNRKEFGYNYLYPGSTPAFYPPYLSLFHSDQLFSLSKTYADLDLNIIKTMPGNGLPIQGIWDLKVGHNTLSMIIMDYSKAAYCYLKYDLKSMKSIVYTTVSKYKQPDFITTPRIDELDFDYVLVPISNTEIKRIKVGH